MAKREATGLPPSIVGRIQPNDFAVLWRVLAAWAGDSSDEMLATEIHVRTRTLYNYRNGITKPSRARIAALARAKGVSLDLVDRWLLPAIVFEREHNGALLGDEAATLERLAALTRHLGLLVEGSRLGLANPEAARPSPELPRPTATCREEARLNWKLLAECPEEDRPYLVETCEDFQRAALAELLCHESAEAAADRTDRAVALAALARQVARLTPGDPDEKSRLDGYVLFFSANTTRVSGNLPAARGEFQDGRRHWEEGAGCFSNLAEWRVLDLEASLLRDERQFEPALRRLDDALVLAPAEAGRILLSKAAVHEQMGEGEKAVEVLRDAAPRVDRQREPRLYLILRFNLASALLSLNACEDAEDLLPEIRALADELQLELHSLRVKWLAGRIDAGRGRIDQAAEVLEEVRQDFERRESPWDCSLVTLDLAVVRLRQGRTEEVKQLALGLVWVFKAQHIHREALAALALFQEAAERDAVTVDFTERLALYIRKAQGDPDLKFEG